LFGIAPIEKKQDKIFDFIVSSYDDVEIQYDKQLPDQRCSRARPDALFITEHRKLIVECDENSHKAERYSCEEQRMSELASAGDILPTVFIRFNPDIYRNTKGTKQQISLEDRLETLKNEIDYWLDINTEQAYHITVVYLFYDKSEKRELDFIPIDLDEQKQKEGLEPIKVAPINENPKVTQKRKLGKQMNHLVC